MDWQEISGNWVLIPPARPVAIVHFLGGAFVATAPHLTYRWLLEELAQEGYAIIATPFINTFDHIEIARSVLNTFEKACDRLHATSTFRRRYLPIYGMGHSMGCKLHLLIGSLFPVERSGNILISFNNYAARDAIPLLEQFSQFSDSFTIEFTPSPIETNRIIAKDYQIRRNLLIKFSDDNIDQTNVLTSLLENRFPDMITSKMLNGNHLTPLNQDIKWSVGTAFSPIDAISQWFKQEIFKDLYKLKKEILLWLNCF